MVPHALVVDNEDDSMGAGVACDHAGHDEVVGTCREEEEDSLLVPLAVGDLGQVVAGTGRDVQVQMVSEGMVGALEADARRVVDDAMP